MNARHWNIACLSLVLLTALLTAGCAPKRWATRFHDPLSDQEHVRLALTYEEQGLLDKAAQEYEKALRQNPRHFPSLMGLGDLAYQEGRYPAARKYYTKALKAEPENARANNNLAMLYLGRGKNLKKAEALALKASQKNDAYRPYALDTLANIYIATKRYDQAKQALAQAESAAPSDDYAFQENLKVTRGKLEKSFSEK